MANSIRRQRMQAVAFDAQWCADNLASAEARLLAQTPDGYPTGGSGMGGGGVSNPTMSAAVAGERARADHAEIDRLTIQAWEVVGRLVEKIRAVRDPGEDTSVEASRARCDGGMGEWADPTCERLAVVQRRLNGTVHQLCYGCDKRRQRVTERGSISA